MTLYTIVDIGVSTKTLLEPTKSNLEPFLISTLVCDLFIAKWLYKNFPVLIF